MSNLRIIADDLGLANCVNEGIVHALKEKWITGASLMANGEAFSDAVRRISEIGDDGIGVHLVLVEEKPLAPVQEIASLVEGDTLLKDHRVFFKKYLAGKIRIEEIEKEFRLQIKKITDQGIRPKFINSHQHLHLLPAISNVIISLALEFKIPYIRIVWEPFSVGNKLFFRQIQLLVLKILSWDMKRKIVRSGLVCNDFFVGFTHAGHLRLEDVEKAIVLSAAHPQKTVELGCHPGLEDTDLRKKYSGWGNYHWARELEILKNKHGSKFL